MKEVGAGPKGSD